MDNYNFEKQNLIINPLIDILSKVGWRVIFSDLYDPALTLRAGFYQVVLESELKKGIAKINPWLEEDQVLELMKGIVFPKERGLKKVNREIFRLLNKGVVVQENRKTKEKNITACIIDFNNVDSNSFIAIPFYKVQVLGTGKHFICDVVLFVNGIPCIIIESELPYLTDPLQRAFERIRKYSNVDGGREGNEWLFYYNQFVVITDSINIMYGTFMASISDYNIWKIKNNKVEDKFNNSYSKFHRLISNLLEPKVVIDFIRSYIVFNKKDNSIDKKIARYYQYNASNNMVDRIKSNSEAKKRGGIVYISYGAGKSVSMVFALLKFYHAVGINKWKVVVVIEKKEIVEIIEQIAELKSIRINKTASVEELKGHLAEEISEIIIISMNEINEKELLQEFPIINQSENILIMIDEQHRASYKWLNANLQKALPNSTKVIFTGSPLDIRETNFDPYLEKYSLKDAMEDKVIVDILHESKVELIEDEDLKVADKEHDKFKDVFAGWSSEDKKKSADKFPKRAYLESANVIKEKARSLVQHYLTAAFPNKLKAQLITYSHLAAVRYKQELDKAIKEAIDYHEINKNPYIDIELLKKLKVAALITKSVTDPAAYRPFTDEAEHHKNITSFLLPFGSELNGINGDVGIIVVTDLFINGFHAPLEQVVYIDQIMKDHFLLQAITRINYPSKNKRVGFIVDYVGFLLHQREALSAFNEKDQEIIMQSWRNAISDADLLKWSNKNIRDFLKEQNIIYIEDMESCMNVLSDDAVRSKFYILYKEFAKYMDRLLPKAEALDFAEDFKLITLIAYNARLRYHDAYIRFDDFSDKLNRLLDDFCRSKKINLSQAPHDLLSSSFRELINNTKHLKSKIKQLECAFYDYFNKHLNEDPEFYERLQIKIEQLRNENKESYDVLFKEYNEIIEKIKTHRLSEENYGLDPAHEKPYFALLMKEIFGVYDQNCLSDEQIQFLLTLTKKIIASIKKETESVAFWHNIGAQKKLKAILLGYLLTISVKKIKAKRSNNSIAQQLIELTWYLHNKQ